jgi:hypothetical protein
VLFGTVVRLVSGNSMKFRATLPIAMKAPVNTCVISHREVHHLTCLFGCFRSITHCQVALGALQNSNFTRIPVKTPVYCLLFITLVCNNIIIVHHIGIHHTY